MVTPSVIGKVRIRLFGIDAPEMKQSCKMTVAALRAMVLSLLTLEQRVTTLHQ
jgi:endonuclease YncB( thermonuclease family)